MIYTKSKISGNINEYCPSNVNIENNTQVVKDINDNIITLSRNDAVVSKALLRDGVWEEGINYLLNKIVKKGDVVLNLGTHIGFHTLHMSKLVGEAGAIYSFEANPATYDILLINLFLNKVSNVIAYNKAAYSENTQVNFAGFNSDGLNLGASHVMSDGNSQSYSGQLLSVEAVKIDDVLSNITKIDIIQMDIEGCEPKAMYGAIKLISRSENLIIVQEWLPEQMSAQSNVTEYLEFLRNFEYEIAGILQIGSHFALEKMSDQQLMAFEGDVLITKNVSLISDKLIDEHFLTFNYCPEYVNEYLFHPSFYYANNIAEFLVNKIVNIDVIMHGATALYYMSQDGHENAVKYLLGAGANPEIKSTYGMSPLYVAVLNGHTDAVKLLLEYKADTETTIGGGFTPLYAAAYKGYMDSIALLLKAGAHRITANGLDAADMARQAGHTDAEELLTYGVEVFCQMTLWTGEEMKYAGICEE